MKSPESLRRPTCFRCQAADKRIVLRRNVTANGVSQIYWWCLECEQPAENASGWLPHVAVRAYLAQWGKSIDDIPIIADYRAGYPCVICGNTATEYHHYLPRMIAEHPEIKPQWPAWDAQGAYLCKYHHDLWHDLVTPDMPGRGNSRRSDR